MVDADLTPTERALVELCHGGEFAAWMASGVELPLAALREYEEACALVQTLLTLLALMAQRKRLQP